MMRFLVSTTFISAVFGASVFGEPISLPGKVDAVTVYRGQAMVTRVVDLPKQAGLIELVVTDLPEHVVPGSLFAEGGEGLQVRSVLYRTRAVAQDVREEVRKLDDQIKAQQEQIDRTQKAIEVINRNSEYVTRLEQFVATTAQTELKSGVLNADTLQKLTTMIFSNRETLSKSLLDSQVKLAGLTRDMSVLQRQRDEIARGAANTAREAVVLVDSKANVPAIKLNYLVDQATWTPSYTINAASGKESVTVLYQAAISQRSGEEWSNVSMTLSTATPSVISRAPKLDPLVLGLRREQPAQQQQQDENAYVDQLKARKEVTLRNFNTNKDIGGGGGFGQQGGQQQVLNSSSNMGNIMAINGVANEMQMAEFSLRDKAAVKSLARAEETITVTYQLPARTTLQSRSEEQLIGIATTQMKANFYKTAVPVLTPYVYDEARVTNDSKTVLLSGPSMSYLNGQFVGQGDVPTTFVGGSFTAGFGIDASLRASRELVERTEQTQGGNKIITFDYRLGVENFGDKPATVRLFDRIPKPDGNQLKPTLVSSSEPVSTDAEYERTLKKQGLLRFDVTVPAQSVNVTAKSVDYKLTVEHDKTMNIVGG